MFLNRNIISRLCLNNMALNKYNTRFLCMSIMALLLFSSAAYSEEDATDRSVKSLDGELLLPDDYNTAEEKKCMTVCERWGEDCIINPRTGSRKCRRVCKSFTEECF